ncbi:unnamed protein product, partial [Phaeothamnion confervicola]
MTTRPSWLRNGIKLQSAPSLLTAIPAFLPLPRHDVPAEKNVELVTASPSSFLEAPLGFDPNWTVEAVSDTIDEDFCCDAIKWPRLQPLVDTVQAALSARPRPSLAALTALGLSLDPWGRDSECSIPGASADPRSTAGASFLRDAELLPGDDGIVPSLVMEACGAGGTDDGPCAATAVAGGQNSTATAFLASLACAAARAYRSLEAEGAENERAGAACTSNVTDSSGECRTAGSGGGGEGDDGAGGNDDGCFRGGGGSHGGDGDHGVSGGDDDSDGGSSGGNGGDSGAIAALEALGGLATPLPCGGNTSAILSAGFAPLQLQGAAKLPPLAIAALWHLPARACAQIDRFLESSLAVDDRGSASSSAPIPPTSAGSGGGGSWSWLDSDLFFAVERLLAVRRRRRQPHQLAAGGEGQPPWKRRKQEKLCADPTRVHVAAGLLAPTLVDVASAAAEGKVASEEEERSTLVAEEDARAETAEAALRATTPASTAATMTSRAAAASSTRKEEEKDGSDSDEGEEDDGGSLILSLPGAQSDLLFQLAAAAPIAVPALPERLGRNVPCSVFLPGAISVLAASWLGADDEFGRCVGNGGSGAGGNGGHGGGGSGTTVQCQSVAVVAALRRRSFLEHALFDDGTVDPPPNSDQPCQLVRPIQLQCHPALGQWQHWWTDGGSCDDAAARSAALAAIEAAIRAGCMPRAGMPSILPPPVTAATAAVAIPTLFRAALTSFSDSNFAEEECRADGPFCWGTGGAYSIDMRDIAA